MIGYKIAAYKENNIWKPCLITLEIPEDAKIITPVTPNNYPLPILTYSNKLRCDKCRVCSIVDLETGETVDWGYSLYVLLDIIYHHIRKFLTYVGMQLPKHPFTYTVSDEYDIRPDSLDEAVTRECTHGIHFFATEEDAKNFYNEESPSGDGSWAYQVIYKANIYNIYREGMN